MIRPLFLLILMAMFLQTTPVFAVQKPSSEDLQLLGAPQQQNQQVQLAAPVLDQQEIKDIIGPVPLPINPVPYILLGVAICIVLLILSYLFLRWKKNRPVIVLSPAQIAMRDLAASKQLFDQGNFVAYAEKISHILRKFITSQFSIKATSQTTHEFLSQVQKSVTSDSPLSAYRQLLGDCLEQMDLIKFANVFPRQDDVVHLEKAAVSFIENCSQKKEEEQ